MQATFSVTIGLVPFIEQDLLIKDCMETKHTPHSFGYLLKPCIKYLFLLYNLITRGLFFDVNVLSLNSIKSGVH